MSTVVFSIRLYYSTSLAPKPPKALKALKALRPIKPLKAPQA